MLHKELNVLNIKCGGCVNQITTKIGKIEGVEEITIDLENSTANLSYDSEETLSLVVDSLSRMGYPISEDDNGVVKKAKSYVSCMIGRMSNEEENK